MCTADLLCLIAVAVSLYTNGGGLVSVAYSSMLNECPFCALVFVLVRDSQGITIVEIHQHDSNIQAQKMRASALRAPSHDRTMLGKAHDVAHPGALCSPPVLRCTVHAHTHQSSRYVSHCSPKHPFCQMIISSQTHCATTNVRSPHLAHRVPHCTSQRRRTHHHRPAVRRLCRAGAP